LTPSAGALGSDGGAPRRCSLTAEPAFRRSRRKLGKALALRTGLPQVAVPTTYAGSEMTPTLGETEGGRKTTQRTPQVLPGTVIHDVELTLSPPPGLSATSRPTMAAIKTASTGVAGTLYSPAVGSAVREGRRRLIPFLVERAPDRLAVNGRHRALEPVHERADPGRDLGLEGIGVDQHGHALARVMRRDAVRQLQKDLEPYKLATALQRDVVPAFGAGDPRKRRDHQDIEQAVLGRDQVKYAKLDPDLFLAAARKFWPQHLTATKCVAIWQHSKCASQTRVLRLAHLASQVHVALHKKWKRPFDWTGPSPLQEGHADVSRRFVS
jgi:hypothetical protein